MLTTEQLLKQSKKNRQSLPNGTLIQRAGKYVVDIFTGTEGFDQQSRYRLLRGRWVHVSGGVLTADELKQVSKYL